jgi:hypothetical protein
MVEEVKLQPDIIEQTHREALGRTICLFCERILLAEKGHVTIQHQPDFTTLLGSAEECRLCNIIHKHLVQSARRDIGKVWLKKLRKSEVGHSSAITIHVRMISQIPCFRASCDGGPRMLWTPELCCASLWTLGKFERVPFESSPFEILTLPRRYEYTTLHFLTICEQVP